MEEDSEDQRFCFNNLRICLDNWHPKGPFVESYRANITRDFSLPLNAKVSAIIKDPSWSWSRRSSAVVNDIKHIINFIPIPVKEDRRIWTHYSSGDFTFYSAWEAIRTKQGIVPWHKATWFKECIPLQAFVPWFESWNRLNTMERVSRWWGSQSTLCCYCNQSIEKRIIYSLPAAL
ncbi:uncharacterized protein LOC131148138 [Malania oleifera]|uniref:uncharacterized protein LOC131148138 n=1 Tax=Malania oleifera TaxID=397392 RepID=UPI0025AEB5CC|nr:uncharacterized protein LOC131148138 [Malania oleifera]